MPDERVVTELAIEGAQTSVQQILSVQTAITNLTSQLLSTERIRTPQFATDIEKIAGQINALGTAGAQNVEQLTRAFVDLANKLEATRVRTAQLKDTISNVQTAAAGLAPPPSGLQARGVQTPGVDAAAFRASTAAIQAQNAAARTLQGRLLALGAAALSAGQDASRSALGFIQQAAAFGRAEKGGLTYLSVLSAIHAASFLATNQTFSMLGSFVTLGAAFGKAGLAAGAFGLALGGFLALLGQVQQAIQLIQQTAISAAETLLRVVSIGAAAGAGLGIAGIKIAADFESNLAKVRAFGGATNDELRQVNDQAGDLARTFGVTASSVVEATSLFARAGGTVKEAIDGATEAIVKLQVASAGELDLSQSALAVSAGIRQFSLDGSQAVRVADNLTAAAQSSALSFIGVQQAFIQAAPGARQLGLSLEDLTAGIALVGNELVKGTLTGTSFKQFILSLVNPSKEAADTMTRLGISIQDADGNIRPFIDIVDDLNKALGEEAIASGKVTDAEQLKALTTIFSSRASLAGTILTREGAAALQQYREALAQVTTSNIVDVLMLPLNKQLEVLKVNVQEVGRAFGGPLLEPIRTVTVAAINFFQGVLPFAELLGQMISVVVTDQGFGALQTRITDLVGNNALSSFLIELTNTFRNVRDVIVEQIIPAVQEFGNIVGSTLNQSSTIDAVGEGFDRLNGFIQGVGAAAAVTIVNLANLVSQMITNEGKGKDLRDTISSLADTLLTQLTVSIITTVTAIGAAIAIMPTLARVSLLTAQAILGLSGAFKDIALKGIDVRQELDKMIASFKFNNLPATEKTTEAYKALGDQFNAIDAAAEDSKRKIAENADAAKAVTDKIETLLPSIDSLAAGFNNIGDTSKANLETARKSVEQIANELIIKEVPFPDLLTEDDVNKFIDRAKAIKEAATGQINPIITTFDNLAGEISDALANVAAEVAQAQREAEARSRATTGAPVIDEKAIKAAVDRVTEASRDMDRRLRDINEDVAQQTENTVARALERIDDIFTKANDQLDTLRQDTQDRIDEIFDAINQRRSDRTRLDDFKQQQEDQFTEFSRGLDREEQAQQRSLDKQRTARQRAAEDAAKIQENLIADEETGFKRIQDAAKRSFDQQQQDRATAFDRAQSVEEQAFTRQQEAAAAARDLQQRLANAKTPEERTNILAQNVQAQADTKFRQQQEEALTKFRQAQEEKKQQFTRQAEQQALSFAITQEDLATQHRRDNETKLQQFRRDAEDTEQQIRDSEEDAALQRRLAREDIVTNKRRDDARKLQKLQDQLEDEAAQRQVDKLITEATKKADKILNTASSQAKEVIDGVLLQLDAQAANVEKQLRNVLQSFEDTIENIKDLPPDVLAGVIGQLNDARDSLNTNITAVRKSLDTSRNDAKDVLNQTVAARDLLTVTQGGVGALLRQFAVPQAPTPTINKPPEQVATTTPTQVINAQTIQAANLILPIGFSTAVSAAVLLGIQRAADQGLIPQIPILDLSPLDSIDSNIQGMSKFFRG